MAARKSAPFITPARMASPHRFPQRGNLLEVSTPALGITEMVRRTAPGTGMMVANPWSDVPGYPAPTSTCRRSEVLYNPTACNGPVGAHWYRLPLDYRT